MEHPIIPLRTYFIVYLALLVLLVLTVVVGYVDLNGWEVLLALTIAVVKTLLVILYFMHVRYSDWLTWLFAGAGFLWLGILMVLTLSDYLSRGWVGG
jgi:cytochrome c oxidase subunit 4